MSERPLRADEIGQLIGEVADELPADGPQRRLIIVGGALLAMHGLREVTRDVDSVARLDNELRAAVALVATRHDLAPKWLNDAAAAYLPATFDPEHCEVLVDRPSLLVLGAPVDQVFLMKLHASRAADTDDLEALWPLCSFDTPDAAADEFYAAYPLEDRDQFLADHIRNII